ncbi:MAG: 4-hydroxy-tetrahydrodipicolinate reductase [Gemmatimonadetes bacterium]|nr:4-hydroxy-tetrahydrodipicolinate reductase [Gemmatimonadota bacterium]
MKLALIGYGRMGHAVEAAATARGHEVVARLDAGDGIDRGSLAGAEVAIDFTVPDAVEANARSVAEAGTDLVIGTTGWTQRFEDVEAIVRTAGIGCIWSPNFSLGVQLFFRLAREAGRLADALEEYDVHVHESHHRHKLDHPSGTGRKLADILVETLTRKREWREGPAEGAPDPAVLWVSSARAGEIPGTHEIGIEGPADSIVLTHVARGRDAFASGAVAAAEWVRERKGFFGMDEMLAERFGRG